MGGSERRVRPRSFRVERKSSERDVGGLCFDRRRNERLRSLEARQRMGGVGTERPGDGRTAVLGTYSRGGSNGAHVRSVFAAAFRKVALRVSECEQR